MENEKQQRELFMTDALIQKLEEKIIMLLTELEDLRFEVRQLKQENSNFKVEKINYTQKLEGLISLLDSVDAAMNASASLPVNAYALEEETMQELEEYAL